jgi:hypothetical protein
LDTSSFFTWLIRQEDTRCIVKSFYNLYDRHCPRPLHPIAYK